MEHASLETWHVACRRNPSLPSPPPYIGLARMPPEDPVFGTVAKLVGFAPEAVVTVSARLIRGDVLGRFASALAQATQGVVLADGPMVWNLAIAGEAPPPLPAAWATLMAEAQRGATTLEAEKQEWQPDPSDDWTDVTERA